MTRKTSQPRAIANLYGPVQVQAVLEGIRTAAFQIELQNSDTPTANLRLAGAVVFSVDLQDRRLYRYKDDSRELVYTFRQKVGWFNTDHDEALWEEFRQTIQAQGDLGGTEAFSLNLFRREEINVLIMAIRGMVFRISPAPDNMDVDAIYFNEAEVFRFNHRANTLSMVIPNTHAIETVYAFKPEPMEWFWAGTDRDLLKNLNQALVYYKQTIQRVRMTTYRQMFGRTMQEIIIKLADLMESAEAENRMLERVDSTKGGSVLHPEVANLVQKDLDNGAEAADR